jgi:hypothetical protein
MALTGKTILQLDHYTSSLTGNEAFPIEYSGSTYHVSQSQIISGLATTGSNIFVGNQIISGSITVSGSEINNLTASYALTASSAGDLLVRGTLTAQTIVVQTITSSTDYVTGSTRFGSELSNTHEFTGSVSITGSLTVNNSSVVLTDQTASMLAPYALTSQVSPSVGAGNLFNFYNFT